MIVILYGAPSVTGFFCHNIEAPSLDKLRVCFVVFGSQRTCTFRVLLNALGTLATLVYDTLWSLNRQLKTQKHV